MIYSDKKQLLIDKSRLDNKMSWTNYEALMYLDICKRILAYDFENKVKFDEHINKTVESIDSSTSSDELCGIMNHLYQITEVVNEYSGAALKYNEHIYLNELNAALKLSSDKIKKLALYDALSPYFIS